MANVIDGVKYTKDHEWVKIEGENAIEGLSDYAQSELSDIVMVEVNEKVTSDPALINKDPYGEGWLYKVKVEDPKEADILLTPAQYKELIEKH